MTDQTRTEATAMAADTRPAKGTRLTRAEKWRAAPWFSPTRIGVVYVIVAMIIIFGVISPSLFLSGATVLQVVNGYAITGMASLAIIIPLACGVYDLSFAYTMSLSGVTAAFLYQVAQTDLIVAILGGIGAALVIGAINVVVVVWVGIDSFIGTLATGMLVLAFITMVTGGISISGTRLAGDFSKIAQGNIFGITNSVWYVLGLAVILWYVLSKTVIGRRIYAVGFNREAARLAGIRVNRIRGGAFMTSALIAGIAGIVLASSLSSGSPSAGTPYLLTAFAAAFVGATQFIPGLFNPWGTLIAVVMLGTGVVGLSLIGTPPWAADMFTGIVLLLALAANAQAIKRGRAS